VGVKNIGFRVQTKRKDLYDKRWAVLKVTVSDTLLLEAVKAIAVGFNYEFECLQQSRRSV